MSKNSILISVATQNEIKLLKNSLGKPIYSNNFLNRYLYKNNYIDIAITGIGQSLTTYNLTKIFNNNSYNLAINTGICGNFNRNINIGETVNIISDEFGDLGISSKNKFETLFDTKFINSNSFPFKNSKLFSNYKLKENYNLKEVSAITVNTASGEKEQINLRENKFAADTESMEGAAFFYVCLMENIKCLQIRSVSNYIEERNTENWDIPLAITNLTKTLLLIIDDL